jgi:hypothetical protein
MIEQLPESRGKILGFKMSGKLHDEDYKTFVPLIDSAAKEGKVQRLAQFQGLPTAGTCTPSGTTSGNL